MKRDTKKQDQPTDSENVIMERMNDALKKMMSTPHETQKEMVERRRRQDQVKPRKR